MRILATGADGFVGIRLVERLLRGGHDVVAAVRPGRPIFAEGLPAPWGGDAQTISLELLDDLSVRRALADRLDGVVHLAAIASGGEASEEPGEAWQINAVGTARLAEELGRQRAAGEGDALILHVSTAEVYGAGAGRPRPETDAAAPCSPYAASKLAGEEAVQEVARRTGLRVIIARPFPHTGRGQDLRFVVPAFAKRILEAKRSGATQVAVGNLDPVREFMHVSDVVDAYLDLLRYGQPGEAYNVACGHGISLHELFRRLTEIVGCDVKPEVDPDLVRPADIPHLVGDASKLTAATGWEPTKTLEETLAEVVDAQAH